MAVVKANGYGHGAVEAARAALDGGADFLGVATVSEARELRDVGIDTPILVLGSSDPLEAPGAAELDVALGVGDAVQIGRLLAVLETASADNPLEVHLKIDTGMRRFGVLPEDALAIAGRLAEHPQVMLTGIYSHFSESDDESPSRMERAAGHLSVGARGHRRRRIDRGIAHISNSAALLRNRVSDLDMVRAGICLYGISPSEHVALFEGMRPALEWRAPSSTSRKCGLATVQGTAERTLPPSASESRYCRSAMRTAIRAHLSNLGWVGFQGHRLPVRGRISMDQCAVGIPAGSRAVRSATKSPSSDLRSRALPTRIELADLIGTIGYEIVARLSRRIPVEYI